MSPKRSLSPETVEGRDRDSKRARTSASEDTGISEELPDGESDNANANAALISIDDGPCATALAIPSLHSHSRQSIQRSIALVLKHDGFDSATPEAMESFTQLVETCTNPSSIPRLFKRLTHRCSDIESIVDGAKSMALSSRRDNPVPTDFERTLKRHNVPVSSLKVHFGLSLPRDQITPSYAEATASGADDFVPLPLLSAELSGQHEKDQKPYIPAAFPTFPSRHTYKFTPQDDINVRDSKKIREQAARTAQQGEDALRRLVRASKMRKQKEVKSLVERDGQGKERFRLWELTMKRFMGMEGRGEHTDQVEIADHSMIVNSDAIFSRKEMSRSAKRAAPMAIGNPR